MAAPGARERRRLGPQSARLGPWVFLGAVPATDPRALFAQMEERLREQGARLCDVVKVGGWLTFTMSEYGRLGQTRSTLVAEAGLLPASAAVQVGRVGRGGERLAFEAIAFVPEDRADTAPPTPAATSRLADFYLDARAAGGYVFTSGEVPDGRGSLAEQAREIYERLHAHLAAHGATPADVLQQTIFVRAVEDAESSDAIAERAAPPKPCRSRARLLRRGHAPPPHDPAAGRRLRVPTRLRGRDRAGGGKRRSARRWPMIRPWMTRRTSSLTSPCWRHASAISC